MKSYTIALCTCFLLGDVKLDLERKLLYRIKSLTGSVPSQVYKHLVRTKLLIRKYLRLQSSFFSERESNIEYISEADISKTLTSRCSNKYPD